MTKTRPWPIARRHVLACLCFAACVAARWGLGHWIGDRAPFALFYFAAFAVTWLSGLWAGLASIVASIIVVALLFLPGAPRPFDADPREMVRVAVFIVLGGIWVSGIAWLRSILRTAREQRAALAERQAALEHESGERRLAEREALEHRELLRLTLSRVGDAILGTDGRGRVTYANALAQSLIGWTHDEAAGRPLTEVFHLFDERTRERLEDPIVVALRDGSSYDRATTVLLISRDAKEVPIELSVTPVRGGDGERDGALVVFRDISERRHAENLEREHRQRLQSVIDTALDAVVSMDAKGLVTEWNRQAEAIFGYPREEALGRPLADLIVPERFREAHRAGLARYMATGESKILGRRIEIAAINRQGREFPVEVAIAAGRIGDERTFSGFIRDITQTKQAEARLERQALEAKLLQRATALAAETDSIETALQSCVDIVCELTGWPVGHVLLPAPDDPSRLRSARIWHADAERFARLRSASEAMLFSPGEGLPGRIWSTSQPAWIEDVRRDENFPRNRPSGDLGIRGAFGFPINVRGETLAVLEFFHEEVMPRDENLLAISHSVADQLGRVIERKRALEETTRAKDAAEVANRVKGEFLANVSHELRTPMNAIIGMTELALAEELSCEVRDYLETAKNSAGMLLGLLNEILDFSKLEAGKFVLSSEPFQLRRLLDETIRAFSARAAEKRLELVCELPSQSPDRLVGDALRIRQVLINLIGNAIKFTEKGEVAVHVQLVDSSDAEAVVRFEVRDTGIGISPADQERVFAPFTQADASSTRRYSGTGLGLAIASELIRMMGGELRVESALGQGSRFFFTLRFARHEPAAEDGDDDKRMLDELRGLRVLVVDDNPTNRRILEDALANWSMAPVVVADADAALSELRRAAELGRTYPLVIVDAFMPDKDGFMLAADIKADARLADATVLMLSSADRRSHRSRCDALGIDTYLEKPVTQADLLDAIATALGKSEVEPEPEPAHAAAATAPHETPSLRVLVAEDTAANRKLVETILRKRGHAVILATHGREAVDLVEHEHFDVVLMDVQMPIMDGLTATAEIRRRESASGRRTQIIAMTAHAMVGDHQRCLAAGMDAYIAKPIDMAQLIELVEGAPRWRRRDSRPARRTRTLEQPIAESARATGDGRAISLHEEDNHVPPPAPETGHDGQDEVRIDLKALLARIGGDRELLTSMVNFFVEDAPVLAAATKHALAARDKEEVERAAHSLKGLAANFVAADLVEAAARMERFARDENWPRADEDVDRLVELSDEVADYLRNHHAP